MKRLTQLENENGRLKKIVADLTLDREMLQVSSGEDLKPDRMRELLRGMRSD